MNSNKFLPVITVLSIIIMLIGATFSYFSAFAGTNGDAINATAAVFSSAVEVSAVYNGKSLIPMNDTDVLTGYDHQCVDNFGYGACEVYNIEVSNSGNNAYYQGAITFDVNDIENLKYLVLDEDDNVYVNGTLIVDDVSYTLGDAFELGNGETENFKVLIWLSNLDNPQDNQDAGGSFSAAVSYITTNGSRITGTFTSN